MATRSNRPKPVFSIKLGRVHGAVWLNTSQTDGKYYATQIYRIFVDKTGGYQKTHSFSPEDLKFVSAVAQACSAWIEGNPVRDDMKAPREYVPPILVGARQRDDEEYDDCPTDDYCFDMY